MSTHRAYAHRTAPIPLSDLIGPGWTELAGTGLLVWIPTTILSLVGLFEANTDPILVDLLAGLAFGVTLFVLVSNFARQSGANFNPAITLGLWLNGQMKLRQAVVYVVAQVLGAILGSILAHLSTIGISNTGNGGYGLTTPAAGLSPFSVALIEFAGTTFFSMTVAAVAIAKQAEGNAASIIGTTLGLLVSYGALLTGGGFNPARVIGPMVTSLDFTNVWMILPELAGGPVGVWLYLRFFRTVKQPES